MYLSLFYKIISSDLAGYQRYFIALNFWKCPL